MASATVVETTCYFISNISCYDVAKDLASPLLASIAVLTSVLIALKQLSIQHQNTLKAQKEEAKRNTRVELFKDINVLLDQSTASIRQINSYCLGKKYSNLEMKAQVDHVEYSELMTNFSNALLAVVTKVESHEIVHLQLFRVFRFALQSIHHDFLALRTEKNRVKVLESIIELSNNSIMYLGDFQVCMQNMAYSEIFDTDVPFRVPADKRYKVITNCPENLNELHEYFWRETNWGKSCIEYENKTKEKFSL